MARTDDPHPLISRLRAQGASDSDIHSQLVSQGWSEEQVAPAFGSTAHASLSLRNLEHTVEQQVEEAMVPRTFNINVTVSPAIAGLVIACVVGGVVGLYFFLRPPVVYSVATPPGATAAADLTYGASDHLSDESYYTGLKESLMTQKVSFIDANLPAMRLQVYTKGELALAAPILAKGKSGTWWETPPGIYKVEAKEPKHFSIFGQAALPFSLQFEGNFFIHGWPQLASGDNVDASYTGGSIRLSTEDAQKVYDLAQVGTPIIIYNEASSSVPFDYTIKAPKLFASEYLVADVDTGAVLASAHGDTPAPIASLTKLMTALVTADSIDLDTQVKVQKDAIVYTTVPRLKSGQQVRAYDLLFLLLQESSNQAAVALSDAVGRDTFVKKMNDQADAIDLKNTTFQDASGAESNLSSPQDLFALLRYLYSSRPFVLDMTAGDLSHGAYGAPAFAKLSDFNLIKGLSSLKPAVGFVGGKVGQTNEAGETYAGIFNVSLGGDTRHIAVVVLGSGDVSTDVKKLLAFVQSSYASAH